MAVANRSRVARRGEVHSTNDTELYLFEEGDFGELPKTGIVAHQLRVNAYGDIATELTTIAPDYITRKRTQGKALTEMVEAKGGWTANVTDDSFPRVARAFLYTDDEITGTQTTPVGAKPDTATIFRRTPAPVTAISANDLTFANTTTGLGSPAFVKDHIVKVFDPKKGPNNLKTALLTAAAADKVTATGKFTAQTSNLADVRVVAIGFRFASADVKMTVENGKPVLTATAGTFASLGLRRGEQIIVGGETAATRYATDVNGFAKVERVDGKKLYLEEPTFVAAADAGASKTIEIYFGSYLTNGSTKRTFTLEQYLGEGVISHSAATRTYGPMSQLLTGLTPNELSLSYEPRSFITAEFNLMGLFGDFVNAASPSKLCKDQAGVKVVPFYGWSGYSTQAGIYRIKLSVLPQALTAAGITSGDDLAAYSNLFGFVDKVNMTISNNVTGRSALGVTSYISQNARAFQVSGSLTALFRDTHVLRAILKNFTCNLNIISLAKDTRHCVVYDLPTLTVSGKIVAEKDEDIVVDLEIKGHDEGHVVGITAMTHSPSYLDNI